MDLINQKEAAQKAKEEEKEEAQKEFTGTYRLLAVTACPTGIAHTYMAAEALEEKAKQMGITIKVETDGSGGTKNAPTAKEIEECEAIIVAADKNVEMARFDGKPVIQVKVADGINKAEELINEALSGNAPIYHTDHASTTVESESDESVGRQIYKHLMNGVSHMLPFVIGGGILIALAFLFDDYTIDPSNFGKNTPLAAFFKTTGDTAFGFMLPILAGYISMSISDRPGLAVGFVGGALASQENSGFLGALVAGFAAGYLMKGLRKLFDYLPDTLSWYQLEPEKEQASWMKMGKGVGTVILFLGLAVVVGTYNADFLSKPGSVKPITVSHRGVDNGNGAQNSIAALIKTSEDTHPDYVEMDIQETKDQQFVVFHDFNMKALTGEDVKPNKITLEEATQFTVKDNGKEEHVVSFDEYLSEANRLNQKLMIEIKPTKDDTPEMIDNFLQKNGENI